MQILKNLITSTYELYINKEIQNKRNKEKEQRDTEQEKQRKRTKE
jgi:hypothetical protein